MRGLAAAAIWNERETDHADMRHESYRLQVRLRRERRLPTTPILETRTSDLNYEIDSTTMTMHVIWSPRNFKKRLFWEKHDI
jgi:hypothetical protein